MDARKAHLTQLAGETILTRHGTQGEDMSVARRARLRRLRERAATRLPPEIVQARREEEIRQRGIEDAKAIAESRRKRLREALGLDVE